MLISPWWLTAVLLRVQTEDINKMHCCGGVVEVYTPEQLLRHSFHDGFGQKGERLESQHDV